MITDISCLFSLALEFSTRFRGASPKLHAVRDFYSHSDWIHNDFNKNDVKMAKLATGGVRAPTCSNIGTNPCKRSAVS